MTSLEHDEPASRFSATAPVVLLGAGASVEAGVPASFEMTQNLVGAIGERSSPQMAQALNFVCGALVAYDAAGGSSPYSGLDVERVFAAVELLAERRTLEVTPFVAAWHPAVDVWDRPEVPPFLVQELRRAILQKPARTVSDQLVRLIRSVTGGGTGATYRKLAEQMVQDLRSLVAVEQSA